MSKIKLVGEYNNWMDLRDLIIRTMELCDTELKFNKFLSGLIASVFSDPKTANQTRKSMGLKPLSKKEIKEIQKIREAEEE